MVWFCSCVQEEFLKIDCHWNVILQQFRFLFECIFKPSTKHQASKQTSKLAIEQTMEKERERERMLDGNKDFLHVHGRKHCTFQTGNLKWVYSSTNLKYSSLYSSTSSTIIHIYTHYDSITLRTRAFINVADFDVAKKVPSFGMYV